ncbi:MAG: TRAP transporter substrate-binding protein DctP [Candidatus Aminicenantes bacterium]|nr:TRAP transporter substrate-binding protein DctP [Candidatus Aminicenantes bacterium]
MKSFKWVVLVIIMILILCHGLQALTIKIGSIAPDRSPWDRGLEELSREWERITNGQVRLKIYPGGIAGSESDMIRKMRVGILGGAGLTNMGMTHIYPDISVLNIPFQFHSDEEFKYILGKMRSRFEKGIEEKGYKLIFWTVAGWVNLFTKDPVFFPNELKKHKISFSTGSPKTEQAWKKMGYQIIPNDLKDLLMALQSGMVNAFYLPPLIAGSGQYFPLAPNMCSLKIAPLIGGIMITNRIWKRIPEQYKKPMLAVTHSLSEKLLSRIEDLERETLETMKEHGLIINQVPPDAVQKWREAPAKGVEYLVGKAFSKGIYEELLKHQGKYRKIHGDQKNR